MFSRSFSLNSVTLAVLVSGCAPLAPVGVPAARPAPAPAATPAAPAAPAAKSAASFRKFSTDSGQGPCHIITKVLGKGGAEEWAKFRLDGVRGNVTLFKQNEKGENVVVTRTPVPHNGNCEDARMGVAWLKSESHQTLWSAMGLDHCWKVVEEYLQKAHPKPKPS